MKLEDRVRASLAKAATGISPTDRWDEIQNAPTPPSGSSSAQRRLVAGIVALVVFAVAALLVWTAFQPTRRRSASPPEGTYKITVTDWKIQNDGRQVLVSGRVAWASSVFPGARDCHVEVLDRNGSGIGSNHTMFDETKPASNGTFGIEVGIHGTPDAVRASCGPRLDTGRPYAYAISNQKVSIKDGLPRLHFFASWQGGDVPGVMWCRYALLAQDGTPVAVHERTLGPQMRPSHVSAEASMSVAFDRSDVRGSIGHDAGALTPVIDCVPYLGGGEQLPPLPEPASFVPPITAPLPTNTQSDEFGYIYTDVTARPEADHWIVEWTVRWATDQYPGERSCEWAIFGSDGTQLAHRQTRFSSLRRVINGSWVVTEAEPTRFEGACGHRLDIPVAYAISDVHLTTDGVGYHLEWPTGIPQNKTPGTNVCVVATLNGAGAVLQSHRFTLSVATPGNYSTGIVIGPSAESAILKCIPFTG